MLKRTFLPAVGLAAQLFFLAVPAKAQLIPYTAGHGDIGVAYEDGELYPHWHFDPSSTVDGQNPPPEFEYDAGDIFAVVPNSVVYARPTGSQWDFIGTPAGSDVWILPAGNMEGVPYLGLASEELDPADWSTPIIFTLTAMDGPGGGQFSLWQSDAFGGPVVSMSTANGISATDAYAMTAGGHSHFNWGFTQAGDYELTFLITGTHGEDGPVSTEATFHFSVVPEPSTWMLLVAGGVAVMVFRFRGRRVVA